MGYHQGLFYDNYSFLRKSFKTIDFEQINEYGRLKIYDFIGFSHVYLVRCSYESESDEVIDTNVYKKLVQLDTKLGTKAFEQLFYCIKKTTRWDIIKVCIGTLIFL